MRIVYFSIILAAAIGACSGVNFGLNKASENIEWTTGVTVRF
jgi:hypothetical protein